MRILLITTIVSLLLLSCKKDKGTSLLNNNNLENTGCELIYVKDTSEVISIVGEVYTFRIDSVDCESNTICQNSFPISFLSDSLVSILEIDVQMIYSYSKNQDTIKFSQNGEPRSYIFNSDSTELVSTDGTVYKRELAIDVCY